MTAALGHAPVDGISPELVELLRVGATRRHGLVCLPGQIQKKWKYLREGERLGLIRFAGLTNPHITEEGRAAIGAPSEAEASRIERLRVCAEFTKRKALQPVKREDPRTDFDYRSYKSAGYVCTLVFRQRDSRDVKPTVRVGRTPMSEPQFLGPRNSIIQPESDDRFVLTLVPDWMTRPIRKGDDYAPAIFSTYPLPLDETDPSFTAEERARWDRLCGVCFSINSRIRNARRRSSDYRNARIFA
ncbi:hypothetical protein [uncultured Bradyrhizobium sp.]|uniref:hypothetical protein n=1 Tax=uncultured Bradyrhizobium sp. TaxID=199684 RepID=UPI0035CC7985